MAVSFESIVPWGRSLQEYERMFNLSEEDLSSGVLDCGGGPASFTAELTTLGFNAVAVDPIYAFGASDIQARFDQVAPTMLEQILATPEDWVWGYHRNPEELLSSRRAALERFLADYEQGAQAQRYIVGELPSLPFENGTFALALCSHLLFLYSELLSEEFHIQAVKELLRVAEEVRIFPLLTLAREPSPHLAAVRAALHSQNITSEIVTVDYELQRGGNQMLRIFSPSC